MKQELNKNEKEQIDSLLYEYRRATTGEKQERIRHLMYDLCEELLNERSDYF